jgi:hypothetical protein
VLRSVSVVRTLAAEDVARAAPRPTMLAEEALSAYKDVFGAVRTYGRGRVSNIWPAPVRWE